MRVYVVTRHVERYHGGTDSDVIGVFETRTDAVDALRGMAIPCYRAIPGGVWKLMTRGKPAETGKAALRTSDGSVWEIYGPDGILVDGDCADEPEFRISEYETGKMETEGTANERMDTRCGCVQNRRD